MTEQAWRLALRRLHQHRFACEIAPFGADLKAFCLALTRDRTAAEDLHQETLIRGFWAVRQICRSIDDAKAFLFRIATNLWIDWGRKRSESLVPEPAALHPGLAPAVTRREVEDGLAFLGDALPPRELEVFLLRDVFECTGPEAARILGSSEASVKMAASRARRRLRDARARNDATGNGRAQ